MASFEDLTVDSDGAVLVAGWFRGTQDLDPTGGVDQRVSVEYSYDIVVSKYAANGAYLWSVTVGGPEKEEALGVAASPNGDIAVAGFFTGTVDFDPTERVDERTAVGEQHDDPNAFLLMLTSTGDYRGAITFGQGGKSIYPEGAAADGEGNVFVTGYYYGTADFDPTEGEDLRTGINDVFVSKFAEDGARSWTRTFGGMGADAAYSVAVDAPGSVFIGGIFSGTVDFDSGEGIDTHTALGPRATFITKLGPDGSYAWTRVWQLTPWTGIPLAVGPDGSVWITGGFEGSVDFDPSEPGFDVRNSTGAGADIFLTRLNGDGSYGGTSVFHGFGDESHEYGRGYGVAVASNGDVFLTGLFTDVFDFDPGEGEDLRTSTGGWDMFVTVLRADGSYGWTRTIGGTDFEAGHEIDLLDDVSPVVVASVGGAVDLDPGCGVATHDVSEGVGNYAVLALSCGDTSADPDGNGIVDLRDFAVFQRCFTGEAPTVCQDGCQRLDLDPDDDIDLSDYAEFQSLIANPGP